MSLKYFNVGVAMRRIWEIEAQLGKPKSDPILSIKRVNAKAAELERELASASPAAAAAPAPRTATQSVTATAPATAAPIFTRKQCEAIMGEVFRESRMVFAAVSDADLLADVEARICAAHLACPGVKSTPHAERPRGHSAVIHGARQDALDRTLESFKPIRK